MKKIATYLFAAIIGLVSFSACTMGDKGSEKVPDSVKIDTNIKASQPNTQPSDTTLIDSLQTDTSAKKP